MTMCAPCQGAGKLLTDAKRTGEGPDSSILSAMHHQCKSPKSCTCQHRIILSAINEGQPT